MWWNSAARPTVIRPMYGWALSFRKRASPTTTFRRNTVFASIATPSSMIDRCWLTLALGASSKLSSSQLYDLGKAAQPEGLFFCRGFVRRPHTAVARGGSPVRQVGQYEAAIAQ